MKRLTTLSLALAGSLLWAQQPTTAPAPANLPAAKPCLIVKHKGTVGRRLMWTALVGVPIAPGAKYDLVDSVNMNSPKMNYKSKDLETLQSVGVRVIVLENKHTAEDVDSARRSCEGLPTPAAPVVPTQK